METWVLIITLLANAHPVGVTSVPGYSSYDVCRNAGGAYQDAQKFEGYDVKFVCISGPTLPNAPEAVRR